MPRLDWIVDKAKQRVYPYTHADAVIMDDDNKKLRDTLDEVNERFDHLTFSQSDWNETNPEQVSYIKNKPETLPASGGNSDTLDGKHADEFTLLSDFDAHEVSADSHKALFDKKLDIDMADNLFKDISFNPENGVITITKLNNTTSTIDLPVELFLKSGHFDNDTKKIILTLNDNSEIRIPASALVDIYTGKENDVIQISIEQGNVISAIVKSGSIIKSLFSIDLQTLLDSLESKSHTHPNESILNSISNEVISKINSSYNHIVDSSKHIPDGGNIGQFLTKSEEGCEWTNFSSDSGTSDYSELVNKPLINGVELIGDRSLNELGITLSSVEPVCEKRYISNEIMENHTIEGNLTSINFISNDSSTDKIKINITYHDDTEILITLYGFESLNDIKIKCKRIALTCDGIMRCRYLIEKEV